MQEGHSTVSRQGKVQVQVSRLYPPKEGHSAVKEERRSPCRPVDCKQPGVNTVIPGLKNQSLVLGQWPN